MMAHLRKLHGPQNNLSQVVVNLLVDFSWPFSTFLFLLCWLFLLKQHVQDIWADGNKIRDSQSFCCKYLRHGRVGIFPSFVSTFRTVFVIFSSPIRCLNYAEDAQITVSVLSSDTLGSLLPILQASGPSNPHSLLPFLNVLSVDAFFT